MFAISPVWTKLPDFPALIVVIFFGNELLSLQEAAARRLTSALWTNFLFLPNSIANCFSFFFSNLTYLSGVTTLMPTKLIRYEHLFNEDFLQFDETFVNKIESSNFTYTASGKR